MHSKTVAIPKIVFIVFTVFATSRCNKEDTYSDNSYFGHKVLILGHRGMGELYRFPGNTYEAIYPLMGIGADGAEIDIQLTKDTVLVLFHDQLLNPRTTCNGRVYEQDWADLKKCKYYATENNIYINAVDDLFSRLPDLHNWYFSFDCSKFDTEVSDTAVYRAQYLRAIKRLCEKYQMSDNVLIEGDADLLLKAKSLGLTNKLFLFEGLTAETINFASQHQLFGFSTSPDWIYENVDLAHSHGLYLMLWSPNDDIENKESLKLKADIIQTDDPIDMLRLLDRYNYEYVIP
jgi:glycerophosphoryl diester phosphodiesterase